MLLLQFISLCQLFCLKAMAIQQEVQEQKGCLGGTVDKSISPDGSHQWKSGGLVSDSLCTFKPDPRERREFPKKTRCDWWIHGLVDWLTGWLIAWRIAGLIAWLFDWLKGCDRYFAVSAGRSSCRASEWAWEFVSELKSVIVSGLQSWWINVSLLN